MTDEERERTEKLSKAIMKQYGGALARLAAGPEEEDEKEEQESDKKETKEE